MDNMTKMEREELVDNVTTSECEEFLDKRSIKNCPKFMHFMSQYKKLIKKVNL